MGSLGGDADSHPYVSFTINLIWAWCCVAAECWIFKINNFQVLIFCIFKVYLSDFRSLIQWYMFFAWPLSLFYSFIIFPISGSFVMLFWVRLRDGHLVNIWKVCNNLRVCVWKPCKIRMAIRCFLVIFGKFYVVNLAE